MNNNISSINDKKNKNNTNGSKTNNPVNTGNLRQHFRRPITAIIKESVQNKSENTYVKNKNKNKNKKLNDILNLIEKDFEEIKKLNNQNIDEIKSLDSDNFKMSPNTSFENNSIPDQDRSLEDLSFPTSVNAYKLIYDRFEEDSDFQYTKNKIDQILKVNNIHSIDALKNNQNTNVINLIFNEIEAYLIDSGNVLDLESNNLNVNMINESDVSNTMKSQLNIQSCNSINSGIPDVSLYNSENNINLENNKLNKIFKGEVNDTQAFNSSNQNKPSINIHEKERVRKSKMFFIKNKFDAPKYNSGINKILSRTIQENNDFIDIQINKLNIQVINAVVNDSFSTLSESKDKLLEFDIIKNNNKLFNSLINSKDFLSAEFILNSIKTHLNDTINKEDSTEDLLFEEGHLIEESLKKVDLNHELLEEFHSFLVELKNKAEEIFDDYDEEDMDELKQKFIESIPYCNSNNNYIATLIENIKTDDTQNFFDFLENEVSNSYSIYEKKYEENINNEEVIFKRKEHYDALVNQNSNNQSCIMRIVEEYNKNIAEISKLVDEFEEFQLATYAKRKIEENNSSSDLKMSIPSFFTEVVVGLNLNSSRENYKLEIDKEFQHSVHHWHLFMNKINNECVDLRNHFNVKNIIEEKSLSLDEINATAKKMLFFIKENSSKYPMLNHLAHKVDANNYYYPLSSDLIKGDELTYSISIKEYSFTNEINLKKQSSFECQFENPDFYKNLTDDDDDIEYALNWVNDKSVSNLIDRKIRKGENVRFYNFFDSIRSKMMVDSYNEINKEKNSSILSDLSEETITATEFSSEYKGKFKESVLNTLSDDSIENDFSQSFLRNRLNSFFKDNSNKAKIGVTKEALKKTNLDSFITLGADNYKKTKNHVKNKISEKINENEKHIEESKIKNNNRNVFSLDEINIEGMREDTNAIDINNTQDNTQENTKNINTHQLVAALNEKAGSNKKYMSIAILQDHTYSDNERNILIKHILNNNNDGDIEDRFFEIKNKNSGFFGLSIPKFLKTNSFNFDGNIITYTGSSEVTLTNEGKFTLNYLLSLKSFRQEMSYLKSV